MSPSGGGKRSNLILPPATSGQRRRQWSSVHQVKTSSGSKGASPRSPQWSLERGSGGSSVLCTSELPVGPSRPYASPDDEPRSDCGSVWASESECPHPLLWLRSQIFSKSVVCTGDRKTSAVQLPVWKTTTINTDMSTNTFGRSTKTDDWPISQVWR